MRTVRKGVFETNSSSVHTLVMCTSEEYARWERGEVFLNRWSGRFKTFITKDEAINMLDSFNILIPDNLTDDEFVEELAKRNIHTVNNFWGDRETFESSYKTPGGEEVVAFGYYGYEG